MRKKCKKATAVVVAGVVHKIFDTRPQHALLYESQTRAQRKDRRAKQLNKHRMDPMVRLMCEYDRVYIWRGAPRTLARVTCMACLVAMSREDS